MKPGKASLFVVSIVLGLPPYQASTFSAQSTREEMESAQTDGFGVRRGKKRGEEDSLEPMRVNREAESAERTSTASRSASLPTGSRDSPSSSADSTGPDEPVRNSTATGTSQSGSSVKGPNAGKPSGSIVTGLSPGDAGRRDSAADTAGHTRRNGIVTGAGGLHPGVRASGNGIVSGAGTGLSGGVSGRPSGAGIVTGIGTAVAPVAQTGARPGTGIVTGAGGPPGHANTLGRERAGKH
jgi:hypothetical protein